MLGADDLRTSVRVAVSCQILDTSRGTLNKDDGSYVIFRRRSARQATIPSSQPRRSFRQFPRQEIPGRPAGKAWRTKSPGGSADFRLDGSATRASTAQSQWLLQIDQSAGAPFSTSCRGVFSVTGITGPAVLAVEWKDTARRRGGPSGARTRRRARGNR
jgi:hypothetical protein